MNRLVNLKNTLILSIPFLFFFNEYLIYYITLFNCEWPNNDATKVMILADTHILGVSNGHWFDKLRREWQMYMTFQTALTLHEPDAVFFLGDLFDEGNSANNEQFEQYSKRFDELFYVPNRIKRFTVMGNHDIGFHYEMTPRIVDRFVKSFGVEKGIKYVEVNGNHFVLLNSMAMEGDGCDICSETVSELEKISSAFQCLLNKSSKCGIDFKTPYSRPIVMQHFPLYRTNDKECEDFESIKETKFRQKWDCLSMESTKLLVEKLKPRAVFGGHTHYGCRKWWSAPYNFWEYTVSSFSWRNNPHPSFLFVSVSPQRLEINRCFTVHESAIFYIYVIFSILWLLCFLIALRRFFLSSHNVYRIKGRLGISKPDRLIY